MEYSYPLISPLFSERDKIEFEVTSIKLKFGALLPSDIIFEGVLAIIFIKNKKTLDIKGGFFI